jgi:hypothetical protein
MKSTDLSAAWYRWSAMVIACKTIMPSGLSKAAHLEK